MSWNPPALPEAARTSFDNVRAEFRRFILEKAGPCMAFANSALELAWQAIGAPENLNSADFAALSRELQPKLAAAQIALLSPSDSAEVLPLRTEREHSERAAARLQVLAALNLRKQAWRTQITSELRRELLALMLQVRATDEQLKAMFYPGVPTPIPGRSFGGKGFRSTWQEAIVGLGLALERSTDSQKNYTGDTAAPMIRDLGVGLAMGFSPREVIAAQLGKAESPMNGGHPGLGGRDLHWGDLQRGLLVATAPLAISASTTTGVALAIKRRKERRLVVNFIGEGGSSQGDWYEALNFAGVRRLPMLFVVENNRVALGTAVERQSAIDLFADKAVAVGIPSFSVNGADPEELWAATKACRDYALSEEGGAILLGVEAMRGCGHAHHDDDRYRKIEGDRATGYADHEAYELWSQREPLRSYPQKLIELGLLSATELSALQSKAEHDAARTRAEVEAGPWAPTQGLGLGVQPGEDAHDHEQRAQEREKNWAWAKVGGATPLAQPLDEDGWTMRAAIEEALCVAAERYGPDFLMLGEDLEYGGAFGVTQRLKARGFGAALVDTPLAESVIIGAAVGAAMSGLRVVAEIQFNAFVAHAFSQIVNNAATTYWRYGQKVPLVIRIPVGAGLAGGPYHALSNEAWFAQAPGLKMLYPATPSDAYHGLLEALAGDAPVLFFEHLTLYPPAGRTTAFGFGVRQTVDTSKSSKILGCAELQREGKDLSIVTWGAMVHFAKRAAEALAEKGLSVEVLDLRSLWPLDLDSAVRSVQKTGALIVLQESQHRGGYGHYLASRILERAFMDLQAPPLVLGAMDILPPFAPHLEAAYLPSVQGITEAAAALIRERDRNRRA